MMNLKSLDPFQASVAEKFAFNDHMQGPQRSLFTKQPFNSISANSGQTTIYTKSTDSLIDKRLYIQLTVRVTDNNAAPANGSVPRAFPVNSLISNSSVTINGQNISCPNSDLIWGLQRVTAMPDEMGYYSTSPVQQDHVANLRALPPTTCYACKVAADDPQVLPRTGLVGGSADSAIAFYNIDNVQSPFLTTTINHAHDSISPRGAFPYTDNVGGVNGRYYTFTEPLLHPFLADGDEQAAFVNINRIDINLAFLSGLSGYNRMMSAYLQSNAAANASVVVTAASVLYREMSPSVKIPSVFRTNMPQYVIQKQSMGVLANNAVSTVQFNNMVFNTVPSKIYIWCRPIDAALQPRHGCGFLTITSLNMTAGTNAGLLSGLDTQGLFMLSKDNGLKQVSYIQYASTLGSLVIIDTAKDLGVKPGQKTQLNISFNLSTLQNTFGASTAVAGAVQAFADASYECVCVSVLPSVFEIGQDRAYVSEGFSYDDEIDAEQTEQMSELSATVEGSGYRKIGMHGGFNFGKLLNLGKGILKVGNVVGQVAKSTGMLPPGMEKAVGVLGTANKAIGNGFHHRGMAGSGRLLQ